MENSTQAKSNNIGIKIFNKRKTPSMIFKSCLLFLCLLFFNISYIVAQTSVVYNTSGTWTVPAGVTSATFEIWGGGGGGGGAYPGTEGTAGGGGGGGGYSYVTIAVTPGAVYNYTVGALGTAGAGSYNSSGGTGGTTTITGTGLTTFHATGGTGGKCPSGDAANGAAGTGGTGFSGSVNNSGGAGSIGCFSCANNWGGGGGGGAGYGGVGGAGGTAAQGFDNGGAGGLAGIGTAGGKGGHGWNAAFSSGGGAGTAGTTPGGGGGGAGSYTYGTYSGGAGAVGQVKITYTIVPCNAPTSITTSVTPASSCTTPQSVTFDVLSSVGGNLNGGSWEYQWQNGGTVLQSWSATSSYTTSLSASATYTVYLRSTACNSLISAGFNAIYTLNTFPAQPSAVSGNMAPCIGSSQTYSVTNVPGTTYNWTFPSGWTQTGGGTTNSITVTVGSIAGNVQVTPSNSCGSGTASSLAVVPTGSAPTLNVTPASGNVCGSVGVQLTASGDGTTYLWSPATGLSNVNIANPIATPIVSTTYLVTSSNTGGCSTTANVTITVSPAVVATATATPNLICNGSPTTLSATNNPLPGNYFSMGLFPWTTTNTSSAGNNPTNSAWTIHPSTYMYSTTILFVTEQYIWNYGAGVNYALSNEIDQAGGCLICTPQTHTKLISPAFSTIGFSGLTLTFKHVLVGGDSTYSVQNNEAFVEASTDGTTWTTLTSYKGWSTTLQGAQDIDSTKNTSGIFTQTITYTPKYVAVNLNAYVGRPTVYVRFRYDTQGSTGAWTVGNINLNGSPMPVVTNYNWNSNPSGFTSTIQSPVATPATTTTYTVTVTTSGGCTGTASVPVTVLTTADPPGAITGSTSVCSGTSYTYSIAAMPLASSYTWTVPAGWTITGGQGTTSITVTAGTTAGNISVTETNCITTSTATTLAVTATTSPVLSLTPTSPTVCGSTGVQLSATSTATSYSWSPAAGLSAANIANPIATPVSTTTYTVTGTYNGCPSTASTTVTVYPTITVTASATPATVCAGTQVNLTTVLADQTIMSENFEAAGAQQTKLGTTAYIGWKDYTVSGTDNYWWIFNTTRCGVIAGTYSLAISKNTPATTGTLPQYANANAEQIGYLGTLINATGYTNLKLNFKWKCNGETSYDYGKVCYSTNGTTWTDFINSGTYLGQTSAQTVSNLNISDVNGQQFYLGFRWKSDNVTIANPPFIVDDISITGTPAASASTYAWTSVPSGFTSSQQNPTANPSAGTTSYNVVVTQTASGCMGSNSAPITVTAGPTITGTTPGSRCDSGTVALSAAASSGTINWYDVATGGTLLGSGTNFTTPGIAATTTYYVEASDLGCTTPARTAVVATIGGAGPAVTGTTPGSTCNSGTVVLGATSVTGTINWWDSPTGGTLLGTGPSYTTPVISSTTTYYVDATLNSCTTVNRTGVVATVNLSPAAPSSPVASPSSMCSGSSSTLSATINIGQTVDWFSTSCGVDPVSSVVTPGTTTTYYAMTEDLNTGCLSTTCVNVTINVTPALAAPVFTLGATSTRCIGAGSLNYTATSANSTGITYDLDATSLAAGNTINSNTGDVTYDAAWTGTSIITATAQGCGGPLSSTHTVTITPVIGMPIFLSGGTSTVCIGSPPVTYTAISAGSTGETYYLDAASTAAGNSIDASTGEVTFNPTWTGSMVITVVATGCGGPKVSKHTVSVMPNVDVPVFSSGATSSICQGSSNTIYTATATYSTGITYSLDATSLAAGNTIDTLTGTVTWDPSWSGSTTITASAAGCSGPTTATHVVTINTTTIPVFAGTTQVCEGVTGNLYSVQTGMTNYIWTVSTGGTITSGGTTSDNTATITWNTSGIQTVNVSFTNGNSCTSTTTDTVHVDPLNVAVIAGSSVVCVNSTGNVYATQPGMTNYIWNVSSGGTITSGGTTTSDTIVITWNTTGNQTVSVNYTNSSGCEAINPTVYAVAVDTLPVAAGNITGPASICQGATGVVFTVSPILNSTGYTWTLPVGATIVSGANTNSITVDFSGSASSGSVSVQGTNLCGNGDVSSLLNITLNSIPSNPVITLSGDTLTSNSPTGNQWYQNGILIIGATSQTYVASSTGHYWDVVTVSNCVSDTSNHIYIVITGVHGYSQENNVDIFPNPNNGSFTMLMNFSNEGTYNLSVFNVVGMKVYELSNFYINGQTKKNIDLGSVPAGVYNLVIENNGFKTIRKIVVL